MVPRGLQVAVVKHSPFRHHRPSSTPRGGLSPPSLCRFKLFQLFLSDASPSRCSSSSSYNGALYFCFLKSSSLLLSIRSTMILFSLFIV
ncbi:hypothetical protein GmHk_13G038464 [Glycine max]|nr:hypothetical protein GmHk_13G038464 [Glycine max]